MNFRIINGPNLNMLGCRDANIYGSFSLDDVASKIKASFPDHTFSFHQSNSEGRIIDIIQQATLNKHHHPEEAEGIVINPGAYAHYSYAIADAIADAVKNGVIVVEVHISNIHGREEFRSRSVTGGVASAVICGAGMASYTLGVRCVIELNHA